MCGIAGVFYRDGARADAGVLGRMSAELRHRGPDGHGVRAFAGAGLAHQRLAIIDLSDAAAQPLSSADERVWVSFNGEIYGFQDLRAELAQRGYPFRSKSDTEVILALYCEYGPDALERLDGMFAFALWDDHHRRLLLGRDRTGKKPLYVYEDDRKVVFASEIKAILAHPEIDDEPWPAATPLFLTYGYVPSPRTFYRRIRRLMPATIETFQAGRRDAASRRYWDFPLSPTLRTLTTAEAEVRVRELFTAAVKKRMISDVPLGAFLSGGIDSTLVVGVMSELSSRPVKTFSIGFAGQPAYDETRFARTAAKRFATEHTEFIVEPSSFELIEKLAWHYDEPFGDSSAIPTYLVSQLSRQHVTVVLTGDGGDEVFAGYDRFLAAKIAEAVPAPLRRVASRVATHLPGGRHGRTKRERVRRFLSAAAMPLADRLAYWNSAFKLDELQSVLSPELAAHASVDVIADSYRESLARAGTHDTINRVLYTNASTYLLDDLNVKVDRASMAASLETRSPFLDTALMSFVFPLPGAMKLHGVTGKWLLRRAYRDLIPGPIMRRKKMGFGVPLADWFRGGLRDYLADRLLDRNAHLYPMLDRSAVAAMFREHQAGRRDFSSHFWMLCMLELWLGQRRRRREQQLSA